MNDSLRPSFFTARFLLLLSTFFTGFCALVYEVTWQKYLANLFGSQAWAAALILSTFLGGLAIGYLLFGTISQQGTRRSLIRLGGWLEVFTGSWALLFPFIFGFVWTIFPTLYGSALPSSLVDVLLCSALILPPTICMGATLPLFTQALSASPRDSSTLHASIYAINTTGACIGCLAAGFIVLPLFGLPLSLAYTGSLNLTVGLIILACSFMLPTERLSISTDLPERDIPTVPVRQRLMAILIAFLAGFYSLALQVAFMRLVALSIGASEYSFSIIVSLYILMMALGAWLLVFRVANAFSLWLNQWILFFSALVVYFTVSSWPYFGHAIRSLFTFETPSFYGYYLFVFMGLALLLGIPVACMGRTLPLLFSSCREKFEDLGLLVGKLYAWNTVGCVLGAIIGGYAMLHVVNIDHLFKLCLSLMLFSVVLVGFAFAPNIWIRAGHLLFLIPVVLLQGYLPDWDKQRLGRGTFRLQQAQDYSYKGPDHFYLSHGSAGIVGYRDDPNTTVSIVEYGEEGQDSFGRSILVNGKSDGATSGPDLTTTRLLAHIPVAFLDAPPTQAALVGFGTGITAGSLLRYQELQQLDVMEISPAVREFSPMFHFANHRAPLDPRFRWVVEDAYRALLVDRKQYSVIVSEPSNPWVTGVERLYTKEFYGKAKERLLPGGVFAQWFHLYSISEDTLGTVMATFSEVFPHVKVFTMTSDMIIIGSASPLKIRPDHLNYMFENAEVRTELQEILIPTPEALIAHEMPLTPLFFKDHRIHTLDFPILSYSAGIDFFRNDSFKTEQFLSSLDNRPWSNNILLEQKEQFPADGLDWLEYLEGFSAQTCGSQAASAIRSWHNQGWLCKQSITALVLESPYFERGNGLNADLDRVLDFLEGTEIDESMTVAERGLLLRTLREATSTLIDIDLVRIGELTQPCLADDSSGGILCRYHMIALLAERVEVEVAETLLQTEKLSGTMQQAFTNQLGFILAESVKAANRREKLN